MNNLALTLRAQGDLPAARDLEEQVLAARRRILGDDHPHTLISMNNLAETLSAQGENEAAAALKTEAAYRHAARAASPVIETSRPDTERPASST